MRIVFKDTFLTRLENHLEFINLDSPKRARKFKNDILARIKAIPINPYQYRKSIYFDDNSIRDIIYKGYTIVFRISSEQIEIFGFVKQQKSPTD